MKALFLAIRNRDIEKIQSLVEKTPALVNSTARQPPKKDDGQSPLQVAFKSGNFWAAKYFLEHGADVNFIERESANEWKMPVLQDAIMACVSQARFATPVDPWDPAKKGITEIKNTKENFEKILGLLALMISKGADVQATDSYGNTSLMRACMDVANRWVNRPEPLNAEAVEDLRQLFQLLMQAGADLHTATPARPPVIESHAAVLQQLQLV